MGSDASIVFLDPFVHLVVIRLICKELLRASFKSHLASFLRKPMRVNLRIFRVVLNGYIAEKLSRTSFRHVLGRNPGPSTPLNPG